MATTQQVQALYVAYFGRPADVSGLNFWKGDGEADATGQMEALADQLAETPEYKAETAGRSVEAVINLFYQNLFNRDADVAGLQFWVEQIALGNANTQDVGLFIGRAALDAEVAEGETNVDKDAIVSKTAAADLWTAETAKTTAGIIAYQGVNAVTEGREYLQPVVSEGTVPTAEQVASDVNTLIESGSSTPDNTLNLSVFRDIATDSTSYIALDDNGAKVESSAFRFDTQNQTVNGNAITYTAADTLVDGDTTDNDTLNVSWGANAATLPGNTVTNIENVNFTFTKGAATTWDPTAMTGVKNFDVKGSAADSAALKFTLTDTGATTFDSSTLTGGATGTAKASSLEVIMDGGSTVTTSDLDSTVTVGKGNNVVTTGKGDNKVTLGDEGENIINVVGGKNNIDGLGKTGKADTINHSGGATDADVIGSGVQTIFATATGFTNTVSGAGYGVTLDATTSTAKVTLVGAAETDTITAGSGGSSITGGGGADKLFAGAGEDLFVQKAGATTKPTASNLDVSGDDKIANGEAVSGQFDVITGFDAAAGDTLQTGKSGAGESLNLTGGANAAEADHNIYFRGTYNGTDKFTVLDTGADIAVFLTGDDATMDTNHLGTASTVLLGAGASISSITEATFVA